MKRFVFLYFHEHINTKLNHFNSISKRENFRVLQFYPFKMNLVLEIRKMVIKEIWIMDSTPLKLKKEDGSFIDVEEEMVTSQ